MRVTALWGVAGLLCGLPALAKDNPSEGIRPTPEIMAGWIRLFDGETTFGWQSRGEAQWAVRDGVVEASAGGKGMLATTTDFADFDLKAECWIDKDANSGIFLRAPLTGTIDGDNGYEVNIYDAHKQWPTGSINNVKRGKRAKTVGKWSTFLIHAEGDHFTVTIDGKKTLDVQDKKHARGVLALQYNGAGTVRFRNIQLRPLSLKSFFNGKDLSQWKKVGGNSDYSITPEGGLNIKKGSSDIQTLAQWKDFALQIDIYSNGDHLNSGVFFRELPGQFWAGYEAQVRNQWEGNDRTKAVDYGTGGLYNRQPARKVVSSDREWFTMTVIASGLHFAIWVNGYQVTDYTDDRPANMNARNGSKAGEGAISLQGHDPTTDLTFRNMRIVELPAAKP